MEEVKDQIRKMLGLISPSEQIRNRKIRLILERIERLLRLTNESIHVGTKLKNLNRRFLNGK